MITIRDIAERLDLSVSTVGRALADHPRISRETKERVRLAAKELGYVANAAARVMRVGSSRLIGLLVPDIRSGFYSTIAQVLSERIRSEGYHLALSITDDDPDAEMQQVRELVSARAAGVVIVPCASPRRETRTLLGMVPHVQVLRRARGLGDWFGMDDEGAIVDATNHLFSLGHRRVGYVGDLIYSTGRARHEGFQRAHSEARRRIDPSLVELGPPSPAFGRDAVSRLLARRNPPTAIITTSVLITLAAAEQLSAQNVDVPGTISLAGFGDGAWQRWWGPGLTTLRLPAEDLATGSGAWLLHRLNSKTPQTMRARHTSASPITLIVRGSTAPPSRG